ncbi:hypothetical protein JZ751_008477 [Albula glossodonta]|uniref:Probable U3 small nucleolar RNA-associated protein 11 n=1 Tax=Albula glossodonta TaxID=121402 RepID=A0A8T2N157_9TELE|nr:hypothetical protein JZ751_008477 [Albula glossodonta]
MCCGESHTASCCRRHPRVPSAERRSRRRYQGLFIPGLFSNYHKKQNTLTALRKKAAQKNPDEFYYKMVNTQLQVGVLEPELCLQECGDGVHMKKEEVEEVTEEQRKVMRTQDIKYVEMKRVAEAKASFNLIGGRRSLRVDLIGWGKKIERMKSELHMLDAEGKKKNKHTFFVDTKTEVDEFDLATHLNTAPELLGRVYNRPTLQTLESHSLQGATHPAHIKVSAGVWGTRAAFISPLYLCIPTKLARQRKHQYKILSQRVEREKKMFVIGQKIQNRKDLVVSTAMCTRLPAGLPRPPSRPPARSHAPSQLLFYRGFSSYRACRGPCARINGATGSVPTAPHKPTQNLIPLSHRGDKRKKVKVVKETANTPAIYKFEAKRKR